MRELSWDKFELWCGLGGNPIAKWFLSMKSGLGNDSRRSLISYATARPFDVCEDA